MLYENEDFKTISSLSSGHFYHFHYIYCKVTDGGILVHDAFWYLKKGSLMILKFLKNNCGKKNTSHFCFFAGYDHFYI